MISVSGSTDTLMRSSDVLHSKDSPLPPIDHIVLFMSLGIEQAKLWNNKYVMEVYMDALILISDLRIHHPEAWALACKHHGPEYVETFAGRCKLYHQYASEERYTKGDIFMSSVTDLPYLVKGHLSDEHRPFDLGSADANIAYNRFSDMISYDKSRRVSSWMHDEVARNHAYCVEFGSVFMERFRRSTLYKFMSGENQVRFLHGLYSLGAPVFELQDEVLSKLEVQPSTLSYAEDILECVRGGMPLEYALAVV